MAFKPPSIKSGMGWKLSARHPNQSIREDPKECVLCFKKALYKVRVRHNPDAVGFCKEHYNEASQLNFAELEAYNRRMANFKDIKLETARRVNSARGRKQGGR